AREENPLPLIVIGDESCRVFARADGQDYLDEYIETVDIFAAGLKELDSLCRAADAALSALGMKRMACQDLYDEQAYAYRKHMRYRALLQGERTYQ
ncbi:MAG: DUF3168 domain-containing protein, partial [Clostridiales bacterium]|nr:DUF3168 domain-containing protein [Clostridiales bacterium]